MGTEERITELQTELRNIGGLLKNATDAERRFTDWTDAADQSIKGLQERHDEVLKELTEVRSLTEELGTRLNEPQGHGAEGEANEARRAFLKLITRGEHRLTTEERALVTDAEDEGGFLVPEPVTQGIIDELIEVSPIRAHSLQTMVGRGSGTRYVDDEGGLNAEWIGERATRSETNTPTFGIIENRLRELYAYPSISRVALEDSEQDVEAYLRRALTNIFAQKEGAAFVNGDGVNEPTGLTTSTRTRSLTTAASGVLDADDVLDAVYDIPTPYAPGAELFVHRKIALHLRKLKDSQNQYLWQPALGSGNPATFGGVPIVETPDLADTVAANNKVLIVGNLRRHYEVATKRTLGVVEDNVTQPGFKKYHFSMRCGGQVITNNAIAVQEVKA